MMTGAARKAASPAEPHPRRRYGLLPISASWDRRSGQVRKKIFTSLLPRTRDRKAGRSPRWRNHKASARESEFDMSAPRNDAAAPDAAPDWLEAELADTLDE